MTQLSKSDELAQIRTLLAAERTYAAWVRTGLAGIGGGLAVIKLLVFQTTLHQTIAHITGQLLIFGGGAVFIFAYWNYQHSFSALGMSRHTGRIYGLNLPLLIGTLFLVIISGLVFWLTV